MLMRKASIVLLATLGLAGAAHADGADSFHINGYGSLEFEKQLTDKTKGRGDKSGSFDADAFVLVFNFAPSDRFRVAGNASWEHGPAMEDGRGNIALEYGFAEYYFKDAFKARAGKMLTVFGIYNEIHTAKPLFLTVKEPFSTNKIDKMGSALRFYPRWGVGLSLLGGGQVSGKEWDYVVQLVNGDQRLLVNPDLDYPNPFEVDDNVPKAVAARVRFHPAKQITVGASLYRDRLSEFDAKGVNTGKLTDLLSYGGQATWDGRPAGVELEYVGGYYETSAGVRVPRYGLSAMGWANFGRVRPYVRYEGHDPNRDRADDEAHILLGGINLKIEHGLYIKTELDRVGSGLKNARFKGQGYTEFKGSISYGF
jgi:hypothetical protein